MDFRFQSPKTLIRSQAQVKTSRNKDRGGQMCEESQGVPLSRLGREWREDKQITATLTATGHSPLSLVRARILIKS